MGSLRRAWKAASCGWLLLAAACASTPSTGARPAAFPGAPQLPAWTRERAPGNPALRTVVDTATSLRGARYQFGGATPATGFDCSGFVRYVFALHDIAMPRTTAEQYEVGDEIDTGDADAGDLVFFSTIGPGATHVGIVLDPAGHSFVHAPGTGSVVRVDSFDAPYWRERLIGVRRVRVHPSSF